MNKHKLIRRTWSREEIAFMRKYYRVHDTVWIALRLNRSVCSVRYKALDLRLRKWKRSDVVQHKGWY